MNDPQPLVLVVDDDESVRRSLQMLLSTAGYSVNTYGSGTDALERVVATLGPGTVVVRTRNDLLSRP